MFISTYHHQEVLKSTVNIYKYEGTFQKAELVKESLQKTKQHNSFTKGE